MPVLVIMLFLSTTLGREPFHRQGERAYSLLSRPVYNRLQFGTLWQVYLPVMTYDLLYSSIHLDGSSSQNTQRSLLDVTSNLPRVIADRHPCRNGTVVITGAERRGHLYFGLTYISTHFLTKDFRICGFYRVTYIPGSDKGLADQLSHSAEKPLILSWDLMSQGYFAINLTVSGLKAPNSYRCEDARLNVNAIPTDGNAKVLCPNSGAMSVIGTRYEVELILNYRRGEAMKNNRQKEYRTTVSFQYQILDNANLSVKEFPTHSQRVTLQKEYTIAVDSNNDTLVKNSAIAFVGDLPDALVYLFTLQTSDGEYLTPVVSRKNVVCNDHEAEVIFYDGSSILPLLPEQFQPILMTWNCSGLSDAQTRKHGNEEVRGSIGELSIVVIVPQVDKHTTFYLEITWQAKHMLNSVLRVRWISLDLSTNSTIRLIPLHGTAFDVANIIAPIGKFVHLSFLDIKYIHSARHRAHELRLCNNYIRIYNRMQILSYIDDSLICSNSTAEYIFNRHQKNGLTFGGRVAISIAQYWWMAHISAIITASTDHCAGFINPMSNFKKMHNTKYFGMAQMIFQYTKVFAEAFSNNTSTADGISVLFRRSPASCVKLQLVSFSDFTYPTISPRKLQGLHGWVLQYIITSQDLTSPSHFMIDMSCLADEIQFQNMSSPYTLRLFSLDSAYTPVESLNTGVWNAEAYTAQIRVPISLLAHAAGLVVQLEDGKTPPTCTVERHKGVTISQDVYLSGPCMHSELNVKAV